jgi:hypothetical protein
MRRSRRQPTSRPPIKFAQLCAIARTLLEADPAIDNFEWKERIKDRILGLEFTYPRKPSAIQDAIKAVEKALNEAKTPRLPPGLVTVNRVERSTSAPLSKVEAAVFATTLGKFSPTPSPSSEPSSPPRTNAETWISMRDLLAPPPKPPARLSLQAQIDAERSANPRPRFRKTAKGWEPIRSTTDASPEVDRDDNPPPLSE